MTTYGIVGPRDWKGKQYDNYDYIKRVLTEFTDISEVVSGGSTGVETLVEKFAQEHEIPFRKIPPNIKGYGDRETAFVVRNTEILQSVQAMIVFWDGASHPVVQLCSMCMLARREVTLIPML